ncbi:bifunctional diaminohydroxyphosphoribosylaminopyrimidine deaminase/5-amino-6-(5-phosphoribosylamino)uracil reductase RibD [Lachnospira sp.]|uniref:bifunctional diaminohydroxyphosphoribosylaminopyrimidine deaminase/5-amino-6-(5-phosphoribosylamino)uracil reductase RibD n=1 Tax=Lachnospira sp. TaxID=2049031 RepID=UPI00257EAF65|nr:bifunctional diaminohydroxyphosphoribosylaminopyrimidine deaminase/5-amino-6-(5-phosphoribosylamino)uracil reductase RibD [Lachnospira sp.]
MKENIDEMYMKEAIELAKKGIGFTNPNPLVGAVIVKNGQIIGRGYHKKYGQLHAEREAIKNCIEEGNAELMKGACIYVTLEPCCHTGKQPPCTEAIIEAGFERVVIGSMDPNPLVAGRGVEILKNAGIKVEGPVANKECLALNKIFFHYITKKKPLVTLKVAQTLDGKIATFSGESKWITSEKARERVHLDRHKNKAILVGVATVLKDNPMLNCRNKTLKEVSNPIRIICDTNLNTPIEANVVQTAKEQETWIFTAIKEEKICDRYKKFGVKIINDSSVIKVEKNGHKAINLKALVDYLGANGIDSLIVEGGGTINFSALKEKIVDQIQVYIAPKIFGGIEAKTAVEGQGVEFPKDAFIVDNLELERIGEDILLEGNLKYSDENE